MTMTTARLEGLALVTGMRHGELMALCWQDVDLEKRRLNVNWTVAHDWKHGFIKGDPKSKKSRHSIQLPQFVVNTLPGTGK